MFDQSIIKKSGQWWKAMLSFVAIFVGGFMMFYGLSRGSFLLPVFVGMFLGVLGFAFACITIRCSYCGSKWVWLAIKGQSSNQWLLWLFGLSECPICKGIIKQTYSSSNTQKDIHG